jgi:hypothetical protein
VACKTKNALQIDIADHHEDQVEDLTIAYDGRETVIERRNDCRLAAKFRTSYTSYAGFDPEEL